MSASDSILDDPTLTTSGFGLGSRPQFRGQSSRGRLRARGFENIAFWSFRLATYFIITVTTYIFLDIGIKGARTVFTTQPPFVNLPFLTEKPETLYVFDFAGQKMSLGDREFRQWQEQHPEAKVEPMTVAYSAGGIWPCIVGTALLVIGSMVVA